MENKNIVIIHYNTPEATSALVKSINRYTPGCNIYIFDNSNKYPFTDTYDNVTVIDNTKGQYIDFDEFLSKYPDKDMVEYEKNGCASAKHCYSVQYMIDYIDRPFMLMDSDILIKQDISPLFDESFLFVSALSKEHDMWQVRSQPFLCFINTDMMKENGILYFDESIMYGIYTYKEGDKRYDTGASLYVNKGDLPYKQIPIQNYMFHYGNGSWKDNKRIPLNKWLHIYRYLYDNNYKDNMRIAVCACAKNENKYIREWVGHYKSIGVDKIFLYDNNDTNGERFTDVIGDYIDSGYVELSDRRGIKITQDNGKGCENVYQSCYDNHKDNFDWMGFFDIDEFLVMNNGISLKEYLSYLRFSKYDAVCVNWKIYGDSDNVKYQDSPVMKRFMKPAKKVKTRSCYNRTNKSVKTFTRCTDRDFIINNHKSLNTSLCDSSGNPVQYKKPRHCDIDKVNHTNMQLNHYVTKTIEEFVIRQESRNLANMNKFSLDDILKNFATINTITPEKLRIAQGIDNKLNKGLKLKHVYKKQVKNIKNKKKSDTDKKIMMNLAIRLNKQLKP